MKKAILAKKIGMTQIFGENGVMIPVTVLQAGPCTVVQKKTIETDGYEAVQVGFENVKQKYTAKSNKVNKPALGHLAKAGITEENLLKNLKEFRLEDVANYEVGSVITADIFAEGDLVDVTGTSKGKGFQGAIKRHNQSRGPMAHGSKYHRAPGSMGSSASPSKVRKGKKLPGHMGNQTVTVQSLEIVKVDAEKNLLLVKGAVPGPKNTIITVKDAVKHA